MKTKNLLKKLSKKYPKRICEKWDHPGLQVGKLKEETNSILLCLDFDEVVYKLMQDKNLLDKIDLIITHHPFIFGNKKDVFKENSFKEALYNKILEANIPIYSYHTNFDGGIDGMNDALLNELGLKDIKPLKTLSMARGGLLNEPMEIEEFAKFAKAKLNVTYGLLLPYGKKQINSVAIIGGGGWFGYKASKEEDYDIFISGDIPHHGRRDVIEYQYNYLDLPHEIENIFMKQMEKILKNIDSDIKVYPLVHELCAQVI